MDTSLEINMLDTAIKELPESVNKLTGLNYLEMSGCMGLQHLPSSLFMLPNFVTLKIGGCRQLRESFRRLERSHSACPKLETLHFDTVDLSDEDIQAIIYNFPNLKDLNVAWSLFVSLPARIKESTKLTSLDLRYCVKLEEIPELPSSVEKVDARHCKSLTSKTSNNLWSQVRKEMKRLEVMMPKREIPEWFDHVKKGGFPVFEARGKFPTVALAFVFEQENGNVKRSLPGMPAHWQAVGMYLFIDGEHRRYHNFVVAENHALLCDLRVLFNLEEWEDVGVGIGNDWKTIQVYCETELTLCSWGVYVYKHETNMEDIHFISQDSSSSLVPSLPTISEEEKVRNQKQSLNLPEMYRALHMQIRTLDELGHFVDESPELLETSQMLLRFLEKASRSIMAPREGEGSSGLNIEDEEDEEVDLLSHFIAKITGDDRGNTQEAGPSSEQQYAEELVQEDSSSACGSGKSPEDVEDTSDVNHNIPQPETHTADPTSLAILPIFKKLLCFFCLFCLFVIFPNLKYLNVSANNFVSLLPQILQSIYLTCFDVSCCMELKVTPESTSSVKKVNARLCNSLTSKTSRMLWL
ncbi:Disease resistance protein RML1B, partial [Mucuna pruriens]